jgi:hypothetical protein
MYARQNVVPCGIGVDATPVASQKKSVFNAATARVVVRRHWYCTETPIEGAIPVSNTKIKNLTHAALFIFIAMAANPGEVRANEIVAQAAETPHAKGRSFFRFQFGYGRSTTSAANDDLAAEIHGTGHAFSVAGGWTPIERFAVYGQWIQHGAQNPSLTISEGDTESTLRPNSDTLMATNSLAIGATQYFTPYNLFWDASVGLGTYSAIWKGGSHTSDIGPGVSFSLGKEWLLNSRFGIGLSMHLHLSRVHDREALPDRTSGQFTSMTFAGGVTGTYN